MTEIMVGLLRARQYANAQDVMTYLKSFDSLMYKITKVDPALTPKEYADEFLKELNEIEPNFTDSTQDEYQINSKFIDLFLYTKEFAVLVQYANGAKIAQDKLKFNEERV